MMTSRGTVPPIEWGLAIRGMPGEKATGDHAVVVARTDGVLIAVMDGLGHGPRAATAAKIAVGVVEQAPDKSVTELIAICHEALHGTRGVVMSIATIDAPRAIMTWVGVGNVEATVVHESSTSNFRSATLLPQPGILGYRLPKKLRPANVNLEPGATAVFATDGVDNTFMHSLRPVGAPDRVAERILAAHAKEADDALVLVARYTGNGH